MVPIPPEPYLVARVDQLLREDKERFILFRAKAKEGWSVPLSIVCADLEPLPGTRGMQLGLCCWSGDLDRGSRSRALDLNKA